MKNLLSFFKRLNGYDYFVIYNIIWFFFSTGQTHILAFIAASTSIILSKLQQLQDKEDQ